MSATNSKYSVRKSHRLDFRNLSNPQDKILQGEQSELAYLEFEKKEVEDNLKAFKEFLENESANLINDFVQIYKKMLNDKGNKEARKQVKELKKLLKEKGFSREDIEEIIRCCERLNDLEKQQTKKEPEELFEAK